MYIMISYCKNRGIELLKSLQVELSNSDVLHIINIEDMNIAYNELSALDEIYYMHVLIVHSRCRLSENVVDCCKNYSCI